MSKETEEEKNKEQPVEEVKEPEKAQGKQEPEKTFTASDMARERRAYEAKLKALEGDYATYKQTVEDAKAAAETAAKEKVEKLREGLPEGITNLLDKLTATDQLEWLSDPANTIEHKTIKPLPEANIERGRNPSIGTII